MQATVARERLLVALSRAQTTTERNTATQITACVRIEVLDNARIQISSTNYTRSTITDITEVTEVKRTGVVIVDASRIHQIVSAFQEDTQIKLEEKKGKLILSADARRYEVKCIDPELFPPVQVIEPGPDAIKVSSQAMRILVERTHRFADAADYMTMMGVYMRTLENGVIESMGCEQNKMALASISGCNVSTPPGKQWFIPSTFFSTFKLLCESSQDIILDSTQRHLSIKADNYCAATLIPEGTSVLSDGLSLFRDCIKKLETTALANEAGSVRVVSTSLQKQSSAVAVGFGKGHIRADLSVDDGIHLNIVGTDTTGECDLASDQVILIPPRDIKMKIRLNLCCVMDAIRSVGTGMGQADYCHLTAYDPASLGNKYMYITCESQLDTFGTAVYVISPILETPAVR